MKAGVWFAIRFTLTKPTLLAIVVTAACVVGIFLRFVLFARELPLWVDEAWTGAIVGQPTLRATIDQSLLDPNAPAYFILMHFWTRWFGLSDTALRLPSLFFGAIAPLVALLPTKGMERNVRLLWCGIIALWLTGIWYSQEARCYSLAIFLAMACTLAYVRLLTQPNFRTAVGWVSLGCLAILTQYHFLILIGCQSVGYLIVHRERALRTWPAALLYLPAVAWMGMHIPRVLQYADPKASYWEIVTLGSPPGNLALLLLAGLILGVFAWQSNSPPMWVKIPDAPLSTGIAAVTAAVSALALICIGALTPIFSMHYLTVFMPGILLGFSLLATFSRRWELAAPVGIIFIFGIGASIWSVTNIGAERKLFWNFERASRELEKYGVDQVVFLLDSPITKILKPVQLEALGGFFFKRQGLTIPVTPIFLRPDDNPNERLLASATTARPAILWLYDLAIRNTATVSYPPRIEQIDHAWVCNNFGKGTLGVVACHRRS
jgi:hypothetical protein